MRSTTRLRQLLARPGIIQAPGCYDALGARLIEEAGFKVCYMGGNAVAATLLGVPDIGLVTLKEVVERARTIAGAIAIPLVCDADDGYGGIGNVQRTVREFEAAGVAGIHIEDQVYPKKCGAMDDLRLVALEDAVAKISAALAARRDPDFVIIARSDARRVAGLEEALRRGRAFAAAGADIVYLEMLQSAEEIAAAARTINAPLLYDMLELSRDSIYSAAFLQQQGVKVVIYPLSMAFLLSGYMRRFLRSLRQSGTTGDYYAEMISLRDWERLMGLDRGGAG